MTAEQSVIIADIHGEIMSNLEEENIQRIFANASLVILHIHSKEQPDNKKILKNLGDFTKARFLVTIRDSSENFAVENEKALSKISLSKITEKSEAEKQNIYNKFRTALIP